MKIPDIKSIETGVTRIEPANRKHKKWIILSLTSMGLFAILGLIEFCIGLVLDVKVNNLDSENKKLTTIISVSNKIIQENGDNKRFYDETQKWIRSDVFFTKVLADIADCIPNSNKINGFSLVRNLTDQKKESYTLKINLFQMKRLDPFSDKIREAVVTKNFDWNKKEDRKTNTKDKNMNIVAVIERSASL